MTVIEQILNQVEDKAEALGVSPAAMYGFKTGYLAGIMSEAILSMSKEERERFFPTLKIEL